MDIIAFNVFVNYRAVIFILLFHILQSNASFVCSEFASGVRGSFNLHVFAVLQTKFIRSNNQFNCENLKHTQRENKARNFRTLKLSNLKRIKTLLLTHFPSNTTQSVN